MSDFLRCQLQAAFESFQLSAPQGIPHRRGAAGPELALKAELVGEGFHRELRYTWSRALAASEGHTAPDTGGCQIGIIQALPAGVYADMYQLENLARMSGGSNSDHPDMRWSPQLYGALDVEKTASECEPTVLVMNVTQADAAWGQEMALAVPLHARYPSPQRQQSRESPWSFFSSQVVAVPIAAPSVVVKCGEAVAGSASPYTLQQPSESATLLWNVPAGNMMHRKLVTVGTGLAAVLGSVAVAVAAMAVAGTGTHAKPA